MNSNFTKREPCIMVPASMSNKDNRYVGEVIGYYINNSNYYNITPNDAQIESNRVSILGYVFSENIFKKIQNCVIDLLDIDVNQDLTPEERFKNSISQNKPTNTTLSVDLPQLKNSLGEIMFEAPNSWWVDSFLPAINSNLASDTIVGYWENEQLHFIQVGSKQEIKIDTYALKLDVFSRNTGILESAVMLNKSALFIGCGSVGSLVAVELAKAGVGKFMLIDNDIFGYHNICRHQCGIYDVGRYKTDALADRILQINPYATIVKKNCIIQEVDKDEIYEFCDENSIVIGGADNRDGDLYADQIAIDVGMPFMSIGCWERAFAGEIFYCLPTGMPTYKDFISVVGYTSGRVTQNRRFYSTEEELEKISFEPGISADVNFVTIVAIKMALDLLNRNNENYTQRIIPHLTQYTLICNTNDPKIGGEQAEIFSYPLQITTSIIVPYANKE